MGQGGFPADFLSNLGPLPYSQSTPHFYDHQQGTLRQGRDWSLAWALAW